ncbi:SLBP [Branchiostoma lanceolatum]|uniref:SLBP protein n=1 Tax=Branchiostoma lanceolatum TaxID=7740 RepID=A0A8J9ZU66_BRALA|nr:SLBP [Branchiostoma lanceolatum]
MLGRMESCRDAEFRIFKANVQVQRSRSDQRYGEREEKHTRNGDRGRHHETERRRENRRDRSDNRRTFRDRSCEKMRGDRRHGYRQKEQHCTTDSSSPTATSTKCGWADMAEDFEKQTSIIQDELVRYQKKRHRSNSTGSNNQQDSSNANPTVCETDQVTLMRRQKQIDYGKNTLAYDNYSQNIARHSRKKDDPWTPTKFAVCSRRAWDGRIKEWRKKLHSWDSDVEQVSVPAEGVVEEEACLDDVPDLELLDPMDIDKEQTFTI